MAEHEPRYDMKEFSRRGRKIYRQNIRPHLSCEDDGKFLAIDVETGEYAIDESDLDAVARLYGRRPHAQPWLIRIGYRAAHSRGGGLRREPT